MGRKNRGHEKKLLRLDRRASRLERRQKSDDVAYGGYVNVIGRRMMADHRRAVARWRREESWPRGWEVLAKLEDEVAASTP